MCEPVNSMSTYSFSRLGDRCFTARSCVSKSCASGVAPILRLSTGVHMRSTSTSFARTYGLFTYVGLPMKVMVNVKSSSSCMASISWCVWVCVIRST